MVLHGVIRPPPEIRAVADRTALYVAKNGRAFESRILGSEKGKTPKFAFLHDTSPFHAYYEERIQFYEQGGTDEAEQDAKEGKKEDKAVKGSGKGASGASDEPTKAKIKATAITSAIDPVGKAVLAQRNKIALLRQQQQEKKAPNNEGSDETVPAESSVVIPPPPPLRFVSIVAPASLSLRQLEVIQLVAQFTAMDRQFLLQLSAREWNNPEFAFCLPRHGYFPYFSALVDAYRHILASWTTPPNTAQSSSSAASNSMKDFMSVDKCLEHVAYRAEYERDIDQQRRSSQSTMDVSVLVDWHDFVVVETIDFPVDEVVELGMMPPPPPPVPIPATKASTAAAFSEDTMDESDEDDDQEQIRLVPNYQPRVVGTEAKAKQYVIDPITGKSVAVEDMPEHMRIQLLDPKWAEERKKFQEKQKDTNLVSGDVVASNLERLAQARGASKVSLCRRFWLGRLTWTYTSVPFRSSQEHDLLSKESDAIKRLAEANRVIREQAQGSVGPSFPAPMPPQQQAPPGPPPVLHDAGSEPAFKRPRVDKITTVEAPPLPNAPPRLAAPPGFETLPPIDPTAAALDDSFASAGLSSTPPSAGTSQQQLLSETDFAATLSQPEVTLQIRIPNDRTQIAWNFYGQIIPLSVDVMSMVKGVKEQLSSTHLNAMPINKIQLKSVATGAFLKDNMTLAALNIGPTASLELVPRARGGRK
jgi:splicing factor 3A subunit 1